MATFWLHTRTHSSFYSVPAIVCMRVPCFYGLHATARVHFQVLFPWPPCNRMYPTSSFSSLSSSCRILWLTRSLGPASPFPWHPHAPYFCFPLNDLSNTNWSGHMIFVLYDCYHTVIVVLVSIIAVTQGLSVATSVQQWRHRTFILFLIGVESIKNSLQNGSLSSPRLILFGLLSSPLLVRSETVSSGSPGDLHRTWSPSWFRQWAGPFRRKKEFLQDIRPISSVLKTQSSNRQKSSLQNVHQIFCSFHFVFYPSLQAFWPLGITGFFGRTSGD